MDGWGIPEDSKVSAIDTASTPFYDQALKQYPSSKLRASEKWVGLPMGQMGNSEVGHMNIGAGRVVYQDLEKISKAFREDTFKSNPEYKNLVAYCQENQKPLHLLGLLSDGGVHSHIEHLKGLLSLLANENLPGVYIHVFTDGRDTDPNGGLKYIAELEAHCKKVNCGKIASVIGRYYAMDRNQKWDRIADAWNLLVKGEGTAFPNATAALEASYAADITDEFVKAAVITENDQPMSRIDNGDAILFYNFRTDRGRQLTTALTQEDKPDFGTHTLDLYYATMTRYDESFKGIKVLFDKEDIKDGLGEVLAREGKNQIRIAETEKYPHVTFFFNGGREEPFVNEKRILIPSPNVATYDLQPSMSAEQIRDAIIPELEKGDVDFVCLNFANPDMVGHTGVFDAVVAACETVDACTQAVTQTALKNGYSVLITADHGNADKMFNPDGSAHTAHTTSWVPLLLAETHNRFKLREGKIGDLAPTILTLMGLPIPPAMTGEILVEEVPVQA